MKPIFALQVTDRDDADLKRTVAGIEKAGYEWINFGVIPFEKPESAITNLEAFPIDRPVIPLGSTRVLELWLGDHLPKNWIMFYDVLCFDQSTGSLCQYQLNAEASYHEFKDIKDTPMEHVSFVKPSDDRKAFAGTVLEKGDTLAAHLETVTHQLINNEQIILVAPIQTLGREFRLFVVDGSVVDISQYRNQSRIEHKLVDRETTYKVCKYFYEMDRSSLEDFVPAYVMDICEVLDHNGKVEHYSIMELNCFHCSGMYEVDRALVLGEFAHYVEESCVMHTMERR